MELVTLDSNMQPLKLVEGYDSLIWTERFNTVGDFQITAGDTSRLMNELPEGTIVSIRESNIAMITETHQIDRPKNQAEVLTIKGRSFESILARRIAISALAAGITEWAVNVKTPSDAAYFIMNQICVEGILDEADIFPPEIVQFLTPDDYLTGTGPTRQFSIPKGQLLAAVLQLLQAEAKEDVSTTPDTPAVVQHGIRAIRPDSAGTAIGIEIYTGTDRSATVYFDGTRTLLDDGKYLFSKVGSATTAYILGSTTAAKLDKTVVEPTGLDRRVILVDATTSGMSDEIALQAEGELALSQAKETAIFDGSINQDLSPYVYGVDYGLGDTVKLVGDYGLDERARVTEFIRSEDKTGVKAYPTLVTVIDEEI
jgi:hypothetical protein